MTDAPVRVQRKRTKGWRMPRNTVYVGRGSKYGNPYRIVDGDRASALTCYRNELEWYLSGEGCGPENTIRARKMIAALRGKNLACWCGLDQECHADILLEKAND